MKKIGYTTGVFDLFHVGHLNLLRRARLECDYLIVGVTTDELSESVKKKRPIIPFAERMAIVEGIRYVDCVVPQINYDKFEAWENLTSCLSVMIGKAQKNGMLSSENLRSTMLKLTIFRIATKHQALNCEKF